MSSPPPVEAFAVKVVEAHPVDRAAGPGQEGGEAGKQLQVDDRVDPLPPCPGEEAQRIGEQGQQAVFTQGEDIVRRDVGEDVQAGSVLAKDGKRQFAAQPVAEFSHRRFGEDGRAHFGEFDTEHPPWCSRARSAEEVAQGEHEGQQPGQGGACPAVDAAHGVDVHGVLPVERGGEAAFASEPVPLAQIDGEPGQRGNEVDQAVGDREGEHRRLVRPDEEKEADHGPFTDAPAGQGDGQNGEQHRRRHQRQVDLQRVVQAGSTAQHREGGHGEQVGEEGQAGLQDQVRGGG